MALKLPPPLYLIIFAFLMWVLKNNFPLQLWESPMTIVLGILLVVIGVSMDMSSLLGFIRAKTTINPLKPQNTSTLVTSGLYRVTRNPMYLGMVFILTGWALYLGSVAGLFLIPLFIWVLTIVQILPEEIILEKIYGEQYLEYKCNVRRWI